MNWYKTAKICNYKPLNAPSQIDVYGLIDLALSLHFNPLDTLEMEESNIEERLEDYAVYNLKKISVNSIPWAESPEEAFADINQDKINDYAKLIDRTQTYPPIILDVLNQIVDGYHRLFALKQLGCNSVWAYVPDPNSKTESYEEI